MENKLSNHHSEQLSEHFPLISPPETDTYGFPQSHGQAIICALRDWRWFWFQEKPFKLPTQQKVSKFELQTLQNAK